jgi:hypothetical protein
LPEKKAGVYRVFINSKGRSSPVFRSINHLIMKTFFSKLFFDKELVNQIKEVKPNEGVLYNQLISGRITLKEYLAAI